MSDRDTAPARPLELIYDGQYDYIANLRMPAYCWLRVYVPTAAHELPVVILAEMDDNPGTSITNFAEKLGWQIAHDPAVWVKTPNAPQEGCIWIDHYPENRDPETGRGFDETFSIVTFAYDQDTEADADSLGAITFVDENPDDPEDLEIGPTIHIPGSGPRGTLGLPSWKYTTRQRIEEMIGQPYGPIPESGD